MTEEEKSAVLRLRSSGLGYKAIAAQLGLSQQTVASFCKRDTPVRKDVCPQCGAMLQMTPKHKKKRFCSDKCRMLWWNAHLDQVNRQAYTEHRCKRCGKLFVSYGNAKRVFCSRGCFASSKRRA